MRHVWFLNVVNLGFLAVALLFWWVALGIEPTPRRRANARGMLALMGAGALVQLGLGIAIITKTAPVAPIYTPDSSHRGGAVLLAFLLLATVAAAFLPEWYWGEAAPDEEVEEGADEAPASLGTSPPG
jgi:cytochrome c oxidase assembly factor CtaG